MKKITAITIAGLVLLCLSVFGQGNTNRVTFSNPNNSFTGSFTGNGAGLTNLSGPFVLYPSSFGARGDGVTDDSAALQRMFNYASALRPGNILSPLRITMDGTNGLYLVGGVVSNVCDFSKVQNFSFISTNTNVANQILIRGSMQLWEKCVFAGPGTNAQANQIGVQLLTHYPSSSINYCEGNVFKDCIATNWGIGFLAVGQNKLKFEFVRSMASAVANFYVSNSDLVVFRDCNAGWNGGSYGNVPPYDSAYPSSFGTWASNCVEYYLVGGLGVTIKDSHGGFSKQAIYAPVAPVFLDVQNFDSEGYYATNQGSVIELHGPCSFSIANVITGPFGGTPYLHTLSVWSNTSSVNSYFSTPGPYDVTGGASSIELVNSLPPFFPSRLSWSTRTAPGDTPVTNTWPNTGMPGNLLSALQSQDIYGLNSYRAPQTFNSDLQLGYDWNNGGTYSGTARTYANIYVPIQGYGGFLGFGTYNLALINYDSLPSAQPRVWFGGGNIGQKGPYESWFGLSKDNSSSSQDAMRLQWLTNGTAAQLVPGSLSLTVGSASTPLAGAYANTFSGSGSGLTSLPLFNYFSVINQTSSLTSTPLVTNTSGGYSHFVIFGGATVTTAATTGTLTVTYNWTNELGAQTYTPMNVVSTAVTSTDPFSSTYIVVSNNTQVSVSATLVNTVGTAHYNLYTDLQRH